MPLITTRGCVVRPMSVTIIPAVYRAGVVPPPLAKPIAIGGLVFFADALLYFGYRYLVVFGREVEGTLSRRAIAFDVALFSVFALHHTVFARDALRNAVTQIVGSLERSAYVWIASALFIATCAWWWPVAGIAWRFDRPAIGWLMRGLQIAGVWLTLRSVAQIDLRHLSGLAQLAESGSDGPVEFKTAGPYGWVRHPIYSGWFLMLFAMPVMTMTQLVFAVTSSLYLIIAIPFEERSLRHSSAGAYDDYMRKVRWKLVPHVY
jgi:protein-S-isoprenylcysteine O-methyltransferase Ste14